ncbi:DNA-binding FrmR family transcriptional regulator [Haloferula luteola]|uniref:DNA-binding FrmR family transcriptional regulator n=1 Tax=Haloferula luteola TaxID=595692 RepID=A0A840V955_9BACT|nr:metal/formaldehyde-sensitive transcriptional repressor [Haloferula luteola]MBB5350490.1 DNA-binding FrmR family transcriptional regulator [Haloferula luteola]
MAHLSGDNTKLIQRVRRLKGQLEGIERMLVDGEDCYKILQNTAACRGALNSLTRQLMEEHIVHHIEQEASASEPIKAASRDLREILHSYLK